MADISIKFLGSDADDHLMPASEAGNTLTGVGVALNRVAYYLETGKVRFKGPYSENSRIFIAPPKQGSVLIPIIVSIASNPVAQAIGVELTAGLVVALSKVVFNRAIGRGSEDDIKSWERIPPGTIDAITESVEKPLKQAHYSIGHGANEVHVHFSSEGPVVFDESSKDFLGRAEFDPRLVSTLGRVSALNGNDKGGRVYIPDLGRGVPFSLDDDISEEGINSLLWSNAQYFRGRDSDVIVTYNQWVTQQSAAKHLLIRKAERIPDNLN